MSAQAEHEPATRTKISFSAFHLADDARTSVVLADAVRRTEPDITGWLNLALFNSTGSADDLRIDPYRGAPQPTVHAQRMPAAAAVVEELLHNGLAIKHARIAILGPQDLLRCHVDMAAATRLLMPLNHNELDFRHVIGGRCLAMRAGELWSIDGNVCHGAANVGTTAQRVVLLIDADPGEPRPPWLAGPWSIPTDRLVARRAFDNRTPAAINSLPDDQMERAWLFAPFLAEIRPETAYELLVQEWHHRARPDRARYWTERSCLCTPECCKSS